MSIECEQIFAILDSGKIRRECWICYEPITEGANIPICLNCILAQRMGYHDGLLVDLKAALLIGEQVKEEMEKGNEPM